MEETTEFFIQSLSVYGELHPQIGIDDPIIANYNGSELHYRESNICSGEKYSTNWCLTKSCIMKDILEKVLHHYFEIEIFMCAPLKNSKQASFHKGLSSILLVSE